MARDDLSAYATKAPSDMQVRFADWLLEETGYDPAKAKSKEEAFRAGVALGAYLRPTFQRSDTNHGAWKDSGVKVPGIARKAAPAKPAKATKAKAAPVEEPEEVEETPAKAPAVRKGPVKAGVRRAQPRKSSPGVADTPF
jgi:hypothetical protein